MDRNRGTETIWLYDTVIIKEALKRTLSLWSKIFSKIFLMVKRDDKKMNKYEGDEGLSAYIRCHSSNYT